MSTISANAATPQYAGFKPLYSPITEQESDILSVSFCPQLNVLCAKWNHITSSIELKQSIRLLARAAAVLNAELLLVELPSQYDVSSEDLQWAKKFMQDALKYTSIRRVARAMTGEPTILMQHALRSLVEMPYESGLFKNREEGLRWLLGDNYGEMENEEFIRIPLHFNMKLIRSGLVNRGNAHVTVAPAQHGNLTNVPEALPQLISIQTDFVSITLDKGNSLMNIRWKKTPHSRQYRYGMLKAARTLVEHRLERLLLNNQRLGMLTLEDQGWLITMAEQLLPKMNLNKLAVITSTDALQQMSSENIGIKLRQVAQNQHAQHFLAEEDALGWLLTE